MQTNKIIGYVLLLIGVLLIVIPLWHTYDIFTGKAFPPSVFMRPVALTVNQNVSALDIPGQIQNSLIKIIPVNFIDNTLNITTWLLLVWILIYGGGKISEIGVKLLNGTK